MPALPTYPSRGSSREAASLGGLIVGDPARYPEHQRLLAENPELQDRANRKLQRVADAVEGVLLARGTAADLAVLAARIAIACLRTAQRAAGADPEALLPAMRNTVDLLLA